MGKAKNLKNRVASYFTQTLVGEKTKLLVKNIVSIEYISVTSEIESLLLEANYIKKYSPQFNIRLTDGKAYPLIQITIKNKYPSVLVARKIDDKHSIYFGPYPNATAMRLVLKTIRRIFPFQSVKNHGNRTCLYNHLGLCPCPVVFDSPEMKKEYRKNIYRIVSFLQGNIQKILKELEKERDQLSKDEQYEQAKEIQKKITAIGLITQVVTPAFDYDTNPNLYEDLRKQEMEELKSTLSSKNVELKTSHRIECFDISNISGKNATGSMVVFTNAQKDSQYYRRFHVRAKQRPNDFLMMEEVIHRRFNHSEWPAPDLIIVDGGKGQITAARKALSQHRLNIPVIGLAKKEEIIITEDFKEIRLPRDSVALQLIMRIRDEAHRFAITYHRKLRSKYFLPRV